MFWGEQPPFMSIGHGGRYFFVFMNTESPRVRRTFSWPLAFTLAALIGATILLVIFLRLESWPARTAKEGTAELERVGRNLRDAFVEMAQLQPRVLVNNRVYLEKTVSVAELAILSRQVEVENELVHTWAASTKRVKLHGTYIARAGFDLKQDFTVSVDPNEISVRLPHASILSLEQRQVDILAFENGLWNRISAADLQNELATLPDLARQRAAQSGILPEAEDALKKQLEERLHPDRPLHFHFDGIPVKD